MRMLVAFLVAVLLLSDPFEAAREKMVRTQIAARDVADSATLRAMRTVQRHLFVPETRRDAAYDDRPLPIGYGQTISQPYIVAYMTELVKPRRGHRVLEIGTGSGYQAAVLAEIVDSVFTIEIITELAKPAADLLKNLNYNNVVVKNADGYYGWKEKGPFDAIVVTAAAEHIPPPLVEQLKEGGKMIIPVGTPFFVQTLTLVEKKGKEVSTKSLIPVRFVPLTRGQ
ncbi:MAG: protein-L-isoaspartate(D-aspartate) O-methyltransferase [Bacteroidetes bacterium]|nr:protein-L-isoaspartate(D-aspartate) O-methyltransferase [Bacteroidota bacterium]MCW5896648.1 protein-L-isoaspartate(D-aspartate) O-methyltransferase [Bacteroidota bacterium]